MKLKLNAILRLDKKGLKDAKALRIKSIEDAITLPAGPSQKARIYHKLWIGGGYEVGVGKPGKETERKDANINDMWPYMRKGEDFEPKSASFRDIFHELEQMVNKSRESLELLACLLARSALMLDHEIKDNRVVYNPSLQIIQEIQKDIPSVFNVPLEVFLHYLDVIALNEDVKYHTKGRSRGKLYSPNAGRPNNLLTCAHLIAVLLGRSGLVDFAYGFSQQRGVSALSSKKIKECFPMLNDKSEDLEESVLT
ncbi:MAG: hypothetical protein PHS53_00750 [Candidatus Pacebacteria bacterium]|nr:hypothetical protein [Candidatus Paceibacterota bacterium]MDD5356666.1 hypothetical protein [Candidatus Paceibacterota bacterium]